ncbi:hypothetical protein DEU56DRAFT_872408 [Suillus clintonianus]|uniref:uncharacterized protein n=1 Tax=Suillus clintonianus TaxID=1904413 RepID=UPI001B86E044|nr:uncharacterized protein DEU56DRAFT_872408 [Suillus clintonianus]KAG2129948.1 hypothetical protein DEU56DRAFT_872408 [Suillus clintonianus]
MHMVRTLSLLSLLLSWSSIILAAELQGYIQWNKLCPNYDALSSAKVLLDAGKMSGRVTRNGNFSIPDVPQGTYVLSVLSRDYSFDHVRIDVSPSEPLPEVRPYIFGTPLLTTASFNLPYPIVLTPRHKNRYFSPHESFNLLGMFQSPMMMIMVLTGVMMLAMPYIMKQLDPETLDGLKGQQGKAEKSIQSGDPRGLSALLSANSAGEESKANTPVVKSNAGPSTLQQRKGGKGNKRR